MPTRKYKRYKKKTVKRRKNKGGGGNLSRQNPPPTSIIPLSTKKTVRFPKDDDDLFKIKNISPQEYILNNNDEEKNKIKKNGIN